MSNNRTSLTLSPISVLICMIGTSWVVAGDLDPPPGPPISTMKTLVEVEPRTPISSLPFPINEPGSYYLTGDLTAPPDTTGLNISASNVTIDLKGYALIGSGGPGGNGIGTNGVPKNILVRNGTVRNFAGDGIDILDSDDSVIENVRSQGNGQFGLRVGKGGVVRNSTASSNADGIGGGPGCLIVNCTSRANTNDGINVGEGSTVKACVSSTNGGSGISTGTGSVVQSCSTRGNTGNGIEVGGGSTVTNCEAMGNEVGVAFLAERGGLVTNCTVQGSRNVGIAASDGTIVRGCSVVETDGPGITTANGVFITDCQFMLNSPGILANTECYILGNNLKICAPGIHVVGAGCRIDGNNLVGPGNSQGIVVDTGGNMIIRNSVRNYAADYELSGTNTVGPIITATGTISTNNPWANFSY